MSDAPPANGPISPEDRTRALSIAGITVLIAIGVLYAALALGVLLDGKPTPDRWFVFFVPASGGLVGLVLGFLFAAVGRESQRFASALTAINAALAGATVVDISRSDGIIRQFFGALADDVGLPSRPVLVAISFLGPLGGAFIWMYLFKVLGLNSAILAVNREEDEYERDVKRIKEEINRGIGKDIDDRRPVPKEVQQAAKRISDESGGEASHKDRGMALFLQGRYGEAAEVLNQARDEKPEDPEAALYLANTLILAHRYAEAIPVLEKLVAQPTVPAVARKQLAYAYLFLDNDDPERRRKLEASRELSREFHRLFPDDWGSVLNEACALAQLAEMDRPKYWSALIEAVRRAVAAGGDIVRERIESDLSRPGEDFAKWINDPELRAALGRS